MEFAVVGISHSNADQIVREKASFTKREALEVMQALKSDETELMILSTCNRSEIYFFSENLDNFLKQVQEVYLNKDENLKNYLYHYCGDQALEHLLRVSSGFDSMVLGEDQILGQVKDSLDYSRKYAMSGKYLNKVIQEAVHFAKKTKANYPVSDQPRSLASTAIKHLIRTVPNAKERNVLIIGAGNIGKLSLRYMASEGFREVRMTNRTYHPGDEYRKIYRNLEMIPYQDRYQAVDWADIVICATASPHLVLRDQDILARNGRELHLIDLALPRDIDPKLADRDEVVLMSVDDYRKVFDESKEKLESIRVLVEQDLKEEIDAINEWLLHSKTDHLNEQLMRKARHFADETYDILNEHFSFSDKEQAYVQKILKSRFRAMVIPTIKKLKTIESSEALDKINDVVNYFEAMDEDSDYA